MVFRLYNSYGRMLETFVPMKKDEVRMYTCGPTVWNYAHIGNLRTDAFEDILRRYLKFKGFKVKQIMNITDVEDNIIKGMKQFHKSRKELTAFYEAAFFDDLQTLNIERAEVYPRATEHVDDMVALIQSLVKKGYAYAAKDGSIYFSVSKFKDYGRLSGIKPGELKAGARVSQDHYEKEEANDFALWKAWNPEDGEVFWETDLGKGRPGWSIECSAMSMKYLGESFDIHTGGIDNRFPHHENEIAQSEAATGKRFVKYWLHSNFLNIEGEEMHKSVGNVVYLRDLVKEGWDPLSIRLCLISPRYRDSMNLTEELLAQADAQRNRLQDLVDRLGAVSNKGDGVKADLAEELLHGFTEAMDDDLGTPAALAVLFDVLKKANTSMDTDSLSENQALALLAALKRVDSVLGVLRFHKAAISEELLALISQRDLARKNRDFAKADMIRKQLLEKGIELQDTPKGTTWKSVALG